MKWFKHDTDASQDAKLQNVLLDYGLEGYGLYWYCLELIAGKVDAENVTFELEHDARVIARNTGSTAEKVEGMMRYFVNVGLFENTQGVISCLKMAKRLDKSMTSSAEMRLTIERIRQSGQSKIMTQSAVSHDSIMTKSEKVMQEEIRLEEKNTLSSPRVSKADDVPVDRIVEAYNTVLGGTLPRAQRMTEVRRKHIKARWREMLGTTDANGKLRYADQEAGVEWFGRFFRKVLTNPHWIGDNDRGWTASLDWVMNPTNFTKILEYVPHDARKP